MKWIRKKTFGRCLSVALVVALLMPVRFTSVFATNEIREGQEDSESGSEKGHIHTFACHDDYELVCSNEEEDHIHTEECYTYPEDAPLVCGLKEGEIHIHDEAGFTCTPTEVMILTCEKEEHKHSRKCFEEGAGTASPTKSATPSASGSPTASATSSASASPDSSATPGSTATPGASGVPTASGIPSAAPENTPAGSDASSSPSNGSSVENSPSVPAQSEAPSETTAPDEGDPDAPDEGSDKDSSAAATPEDHPSSGDDEDGDESDNENNSAPEEKPGDGNDTSDGEKNESEDDADNQKIDEETPPLAEQPRSIGASADKENTTGTGESAGTEADKKPAGTNNASGSDADTDTDKDADKDTEEPACGMEEHEHTEECYTVIYACRKAETESVYAWNWYWGEEEAPEELQGISTIDADSQTQEYDSSKEWTMTLESSKKRMTVSSLEKEYLPRQIEAVKVEITENEEGEEQRQETSEIMDISWEVESGELSTAEQETNKVVLRAVPEAGNESDESSDTEKITAFSMDEEETEEKIEAENLPEMRMTLWSVARDGLVHNNDELKEAFEAAVPGEETIIRLGDSFDVTDGIDIGNKDNSDTYNIILDLNGCTLTYTASDGGSGVNRLFFLRNASIFTIKDSNSGGGINCNLGKEAPIVVAGGGELNIEGGTISCPESNSAVSTGSAWTGGADTTVTGAVINLKGGKIINSGTDSGNGGGIFFNSNGTLNISGGEITGNKGAFGGGVYVKDGTLNISGGEIVGNTSMTRGGGVYLENSKLIMNGGTVEGNTGGNGGGICGYNGSNAGISGGSITGNTANYNGGGVYLATGQLTITDNGEITGNTSTECGGGIYAKNVAINMSGGIVGNNTATEDGGGIYFAEGKMTLSGGEIKSNVSDWPHNHSNVNGGEPNRGGGGIFAGGELNMSGGTIADNKTGASGGGIEVSQANTNPGFAYTGTLTMTGGDISGNIAEHHEGGGIRIDSNRDNVISGGTISGNKTNTMQDWGGGGIFVGSGSQLKVLNAVVSDNEAAGYGGGVCGCPTGQIGILTISGTAIYNNSAKRENNPQNQLKPNTEGGNVGEYGKDFFSAAKQETPESVVFGTMLGGGDADWIGKVDGKDVVIRRGSQKTGRVFGLDAFPTSADIEKAVGASAVTISGNHSNTNGAGIMSNGLLIMGESASSNSWSLPAEKLYKNVSGSTVQQNGGEFEFYLLSKKPVISTKGEISFEDNSTLTDNLISKAQNDNKGRILFEIENGTAGKHTYYVAEKKGTDTDVTYDRRIFKVEVTLEKKTVISGSGASGEILAVRETITSVVSEDGSDTKITEITFSNTTKATPRPTPTPTDDPPGEVQPPSETPDVPVVTPTPGAAATPSAGNTITPGATVTPRVTPAVTVTPRVTPGTATTPRVTATPRITPGDRKSVV